MFGNLLRAAEATATYMYSTLLIFVIPSTIYYLIAVVDTDIGLHGLVV